ncbi:MAG: hypothetical protein MUO68_06140 [Desulfobacteraceae bacterium]|nr:hypothetical protein [Desulfobacteraceae bacterium]
MVHEELLNGMHYDPAACLLLDRMIPADMVAMAVGKDQLPRLSPSTIICHIASYISDSPG